MKRGNETNIGTKQTELKAFLEGQASINLAYLADGTSNLDHKKIPSIEESEVTRT